MYKIVYSDFLSHHTDGCLSIQDTIHGQRENVYTCILLLLAAFVFIMLSKGSNNYFHWPTTIVY